MRLKFLPLLFICWLQLLVPLVSMAEPLKLMGSTTIKPVIDHLDYIVNGAERTFLHEADEENLQQVDKWLSQEFKDRVIHHFGGVDFSIRPGGSSIGIRSAFMGNAHVGLASRDMLDNEIDLLNQLEIIQIGSDSLVFMVDIKNPVNEITSMELNQVYSGEITHWNEVGGRSERIQLIGKGTHHGTFEVFVRALGLEGQELPHIATFETESRISLMITKRLNAGVGFGSLGALNQGDVGEKFKLLTIDGANPLNGGNINIHYPYIRPLNLIVRRDVMDNESVQKLLMFFRGQDGKDLLKAHGFITVQN
ncbi:substrate-binding domain-containing protein [uncultured Vibrio sp.]|uniref:substrate-binding domain-containing protein n=1 Tax=uncultured Vibrio sp. TaxID=114054 RepID=UPI0025DCABAF|nr:substrate-binding domain-containing protein [uncultured Vibrio sp.]